MPSQPRNIKKTITIHDLASEMNVSASTISRALKEHPSISKKTIERVKQLAKKRGYRPNRLAASLRTQSTMNIGIIVSQIDRPFVSSLISGAEAAARKQGYNVIISQSQDNYENERGNAKAMLDSQVCGLIVTLAMETEKFDHFTPFFENGTPLIFVDRVPDELDGHKVVIDNFKAGFDATEHLIEQGCRRIAHLGGMINRNVYRERLRGYTEALKKHGLPIDESLIRHGQILSLEEGMKMAKELLNLPMPPDGIFSANDKSAVSAIQYAKSIGMKIPEELALIGFNDDPVCEIIEPSLSSVSHPAKEMGRLAVEYLIKSKNSRSVVEGVELETGLVLRASSLRRT